MIITQCGEQIIISKNLYGNDIAHQIWWAFLLRCVKIKILLKKKFGKSCVIKKKVVIFVLYLENNRYFNFKNSESGRINKDYFLL